MSMLQEHAFLCAGFIKTSHGQAHDTISPVEDLFCDMSDMSDICDISAICWRHQMNLLTTYLLFFYTWLAKRTDILLAIRCQNRPTTVL